MQSIGEIIKRGARRGVKATGYGKLVDLHKIRTQWPLVVGEKLAAKTFPYAVKDRRLYVNAEGSAWLAEMEYIQDEIIGRLRKTLDLDIEELQFRVAVLPKNRDGSFAVGDAPSVNVRRVEAPALQQQINLLPTSLQESMQRILQKIKK